MRIAALLHLPLALFPALALASTPSAQVTVVLESAGDSAGGVRRHELDAKAGLDLASVEWTFLRFEGLARAEVRPASDAALLSVRSAGPARERGAGGRRDTVIGRPSGGAGDRLDFRLSVGASLQVDVDHVAQVVFPGRVGEQGRGQLEPPEQGDRLFWLRESGLDRIDGTLEEFTSEGVRFDSLLGSREFAWSEIAALYVAALGELAAEGEGAPGLPVIADLVDGGRLRGRALDVKLDGLQLALSGAGRLTLPLAGIAEVAVDDGRIAFLSDVAPAETTEGSPFDDDLGLRWPHRLDRSVTGRELTVGGRTWRRGIGVHAPSRLSWELDGSWSKLVGSVGIDDEVLALPHHGAVVFRVHVDGKVQWQSPTLRGGDGVRTIPPVSLDGARRLTLEVDMDEQSFVADRADWLRMLLVR